MTKSASLLDVRVDLAAADLVVACSEVISGRAVSPPTVLIPRPLTVRRPAFFVSVSSEGIAVISPIPAAAGLV